MKEQAEVGYRQGTAEESCAMCEFFEPPESCTQVKGTISSAGLCDLFMPKGQGQEQGTPDMAGLESMLFGGGL